MNVTKSEQILDSKGNTKSTIYDDVTNSIIGQLENGAAPWIKPWSATLKETDRNMVSQKAYRGVNRLILGCSGMANAFSMPVWASFKQWQSLGAMVKKGSKGTKIVFYSPVNTTDKVTGEESSYALLKSYAVFNIDQVEGITLDRPEALPDSVFVGHADAETFMAKSGAVITHGGDSAFYMPSMDRIQLPRKESFTDASSYYATALHELTHWTSHASRCDRDLSKGKFGNSEYAFEELVAELGAAFLCQDLGIKGELRHAGYIGHWLKALKNDSRAIFKASALAQKSSDYLHNVSEAIEESAA